MAERLSQQEYNKRKEKFEQGFGYCSKCKQFKLLAEFASNKAAMFGHHTWCRECHSNYRKGDKIIQKKMRDRARVLMRYYIDLAGGRCQKCGYNRSQFALDFHHINRSEKEHNPSILIAKGNHKEITKELDKCVLLCSNCHREYNGSLWVAEFIKRDGLGWTIKRKSIVETNYDEYEALPDKYRYSQISLV